MYNDGQGFPQNDAEAVRWFRKAAELGCAPAMYNLGLMYGQGKGVPLDVSEAVKWLQKAAREGNPNAQGALRQLGKNW